MIRRLVAYLRAKSLMRRLVSAFAISATLIWLLAAGWSMYYALSTGSAMAERQLTSYARQVLVAARLHSGDLQRLGTAIAEIETIENSERYEATALQEETRIQVWRNGVPVDSAFAVRGTAARPPLPPALPQRLDGPSEFDFDGSHWTGVAVSDAASNTVVRVALRDMRRVNLVWPSLGLAFLPLLASLPLLLVPAWIMSRHALKPVRALVDEISERVQRGGLTPIGASPYRELSPLVTAMNALMSRLQDQLERERAFVADVAHELKTPLAIMQSNVGALQTAATDARRASALTDLDAGLARATHLIRQLLRMVRLEHDAPSEPTRRIDLAEFVRERVGQTIVLAHARQLTLEVDAPERCVQTLDVEAFAAVLDNLVDNAIKYSPAGGRVRVTLARGDEDRVELSVLDQGPGIPVTDRETVFDRFTRLNTGGQSRNTGGQSSNLSQEAAHEGVDVDGVEGGAGLGLSIVRRAAARLGGRIELGDGDGHREGDSGSAGGNGIDGGQRFDLRTGLRATLSFPGNAAQTS